MFYADLSIKALKKEIKLSNPEMLVWTQITSGLVQSWRGVPIAKQLPIYAQLINCNDRSGASLDGTGSCVTQGFPWKTGR